MRLVTHNFLQSNVKGTEKGYPLIIEATQVIVEESPLDRDLLFRLLPKLNYGTIVEAGKQLAPHCPVEEVADFLAHLPAELPMTNNETNDDGDGSIMDDRLVLQLYRVLFDVHMLEGQLICPDTGRKFPVKDGIPNMILHEDEI